MESGIEDAFLRNISNLFKYDLTQSNSQKIYILIKNIRVDILLNSLLTPSRELVIQLLFFLYSFFSLVNVFGYVIYLAFSFISLTGVRVVACPSIDYGSA